MPEAKQAATVIPPAEGSRPRPGWFLPFALSTVACLWAFGLPGDLWLDEIWTVTFASTLRNPFEILTTPSLDNNHPIVTFAAWLLGPRRPEIAYRLLLSPAPGLVLPRGFVYQFESAFPVRGPSGYTWNVYRRCESCEPSPDLPVIRPLRGFSVGVP